MISVRRARCARTQSFERTQHLGLVIHEVPDDDVRVAHVCITAQEVGDLLGAAVRAGRRGETPGTRRRRPVPRSARPRPRRPRRAHRGGWRSRRVRARSVAHARGTWSACSRARREGRRRRRASRPPRSGALDRLRRRRPDPDVDRPGGDRRDRVSSTEVRTVGHRDLLAGQQAPDDVDRLLEARRPARGSRHPSRRTGASPPPSAHCSTNGPFGERCERAELLGRRGRMPERQEHEVRRPAGRPTRRAVVPWSGTFWK